MSREKVREAALMVLWVLMGAVVAGVIVTFYNLLLRITLE